MKKQLLFTLAFFTAVTFTSAQSGVSVDHTNTSTPQNFLFGSDKDIRDASVVTVTAGSGSAQTNKPNWLAIIGSQDDLTEGKFEFTLQSTGDNLLTSLSINFAKRKGSRVGGTISIPGNANTDFVLASDNTDSKTIEAKTIAFETDVILTSSPKTVTITIDDISMATLIATSTPNIRLTDMNISVLSVLDVNDIVETTQENTLFPNPVTGSFQISSEEAIQNVQVYGINGSLLRTFNAQASYDISNLTAGVYFVKSNTASGSKTVKIVKK
ncbi:T9SS type A sorting domain-containing protein [Flavicella sediminum]|uniref:T9SS type A sorting domain-containing protein n=1 Tax=Flavicella sediminum TaxID=2585141 RepID=UPI00111C9B17|nr:T9SS type A sorting domain-containing protein [Flavicella sediminum]